MDSTRLERFFVNSENVIVFDFSGRFFAFFSVAKISGGLVFHHSGAFCIILDSNISGQFLFVEIVAV